MRYKVVPNKHGLTGLALDFLTVVGDSGELSRFMFEQFELPSVMLLRQFQVLLRLV